MPAAKFPITIEQGATFLRTLTIKDNATPPVAIDLTGASARGQVRQRHSASTAYDFTLTITDAVNGEIEWTMDAVTTASLPVTQLTQNWVYDIEIVYANGVTDRIMEGPVTISPNVTR